MDRELPRCLGRQAKDEVRCYLAGRFAEEPWGQYMGEDRDYERNRGGCLVGGACEERAHQGVLITPLRAISCLRKSSSLEALEGGKLPNLGSSAVTEIATILLDYLM